MSMPRALEGGCIPSPSVDMPVSGRSCSKEGVEWWFPFAITLQSYEAKCWQQGPADRAGHTQILPKGVFSCLAETATSCGVRASPTFLSWVGGCEAQKDVARLRSFHCWLVTRTSSLSPSLSCRELAAEAARMRLSCAWEGWQWSVNPLSRSQSVLGAVCNKKIAPE